MHRASGRRLRETIFARDDYRCVYCAVVRPASHLTIDHVEARMRGGDQSEGNLVTCCRTCNQLKAGMPAWGFLALYPELRDNFLRHARFIWPRLRRAVLEAASKQPSPRSRSIRRRQRIRRGPLR